MINNPFFGLLLNDHQSKGSRIPLPLTVDVGSLWWGEAQSLALTHPAGSVPRILSSISTFGMPAGGTPCREGAEWDHGGERNAGRGAGRGGAAGAVCGVRRSLSRPPFARRRKWTQPGAFRRTDGPAALPAGGVRSRGGPRHGHPGEDLRDREGNRPHPEEQRCRGGEERREAVVAAVEAHRLGRAGAGRSSRAALSPRAPSAARRVPAVGAGLLVAPGWNSDA